MDVLDSFGLNQKWACSFNTLFLIIFLLFIHYLVEYWTKYVGNFVRNNSCPFHSIRSMWTCCVIIIISFKHKTKQKKYTKAYILKYFKNRMVDSSSNHISWKYFIEWFSQWWIGGSYKSIRGRKYQRHNHESATGPLHKTYSYFTPYYYFLIFNYQEEENKAPGLITMLSQSLSQLSQSLSQSQVKRMLGYNPCIMASPYF